MAARLPLRTGPAIVKEAKEWLAATNLGVSRGLCSLEDVHRLHKFAEQQLAASGGLLDAIAVCPHSAEANCECRKPRIAMARQIEAQLNCQIDYRSSWTIGDKVSDIGFGAALGTQTALIRSRYWMEQSLDTRPTLIVDSLFDAAVQIVAMDAGDGGNEYRRNSSQTDSRGDQSH